ncbi:disintegrin and metalloproteinase domain-containing protein 30 [Loxodonta africana]|uniref:disintegrin and metalloproteinase domain-containing protein 30 n=1 Tax=Loxodonta africana TaxID=9785 RepID=UPI0030CF193F
MGSSLYPDSSILLLALLAIRADPGCLGQSFNLHSEWGFDSYEIIIPRKVSPRMETQTGSGQVSYLLHLTGKNYILHLRPNRLLLPRHLRVFSFTDQGDFWEDHPYLPRDCNYLGFVEGSQESEATLSTCLGGLQGILKMEEQVYQIEPLRASSSFEHIFYLLKDEEFSPKACGLTDEETEWQISRQDSSELLESRDTYIHRKYLELLLVFDHKRFVFRKHNLTHIIFEGLLMAGFMDSQFQALNLRIHLSAIEIWTDSDKINTSSKQLLNVLHSFSKYRRDVQYPRIQTDWSHLFVKDSFGDARGWGWIRGVCDKYHGASASTLGTGNMISPAYVSTHELGHGVGMTHDSGLCQCRGGSPNCIMGLGHNGFSNCSFINYFNLINKMADCLNNIPEVAFSVKECGDKVVDEGEECDCGSKEDCKNNVCCQPDCKLKPGASCSIGLCCHQCRFRPSGYICRKELNECDLAEYCDGNSSVCPADTYKQDGTPCRAGSLCYKKGCYIRYLQCQSIFGEGARDAPHQCYDAMNILGDRFGNCGLQGTGYLRCKSENALCGRLQCTNVKAIPNMPDHTTLISTHLQKDNLLCWGTEYHVSLLATGLPDLGVVRDGTSCGDNLVCVNRECVKITTLHFDCLPEKCNNRGICNNRKNCHCKYGWAPPFCEAEGFGGSIDSGPAGKMKERPVLYVIFIRLFLLMTSVITVLFRKMIGNLLRPI